MRVALLILMLALPIAAAAETLPDGVRLVVVDGDTVDVADKRTGAPIERIRLIGFDAPEITHAKCPDERQRGILAAAELARLFAGRHQVTMERSARRDKYRRTVARISVDGVDVAETMIAGGFARPYDGGKRRPWCTG